ncbi:MAG: serine/threonine protein kinase [Deltaproteobacteria bacterium]|nr:serine/threonine protein kinase [Deltaproteobacteria bacterium]
MGRVLGERWQVHEKIGTGGMASVHLGVDLRLGRKVACKILHPHVAENPDARERLAREARAIAQLKHENVIEVYDYAIDDPECTWLVTELIEGCSLRQFLDRTAKPMPEVAVMITTEVVKALRAAHAVGVIHRDVKPDNILVGVEGRPKLSDFGIAKVLSESRMTTTGNLVGSPSYMSPEQSDGLHTDHRTDLFSIGIVLYRLVTGTLPFRGGTPIETIRRVSACEYVDPTELAPECAGAVAGIIRRALTRELNGRYQSAEEMLADLMTVLQDAGLTATWEELPRYFADPDGYQAALRPRLARELEVRGKALLDAGEESRAVDCFNRALSLGEGNQRTLDLVKELSRRRNQGRFRRLAWAAGGAVAGLAAILVLVMGTDLMRTPRPNPAEAAQGELRAEPLPLPPPTPLPEAPAADAPPPSEAAVTAPEPAPVETKVEPKPKPKRRNPVPKSTEPAPEIKAAPPPPPPAPPPVEMGVLQVGTRVWVDVYVDGRKVGRAPNRTRYELPAGQHTLKAEQPGSDCTSFEDAFTIRPGETTRMRLSVSCP